MDVSIIIVNYNTSSLLINCLNSVFCYTEGINIEVIIVDNGSSDESLSLINEKFGEKIILLALGKNVGFSRANNEGVKISKGRNIFFLNPDTMLLNNAIKKLSDYLDKNSDVGAIGGNLFNIDLKPIHSFKRFFPSVFWEFNELFCGYPEKIVYGQNSQFNNSNNPLDVAFITGADLMIPRWVFDLTGGFEPIFFMYFEEADLEKRIAALQLRRVCLPSAKIIHLEGGSFTKTDERMEIYLKGRKLYLKINSNKFINFLCNSIFYIKIYSRILFFGILFNKPKLIYWIKLKKLFNHNH